MKKLDSSLKNMLLVLTGVTALAVALLAYFNQITKEPIAKANMQILNEALMNVVPEFDNNPVEESDTIFSTQGNTQVVDFIIYPAKKEGKWIGSAVQSASLGFGGEIKILVGFDENGKIYNYYLLSHAETPGLGSKADIWFKEGEPGNIIGKSPGDKPLAVDKDGGEVNSITASTITTRAFLNAVNNAYQAYLGGDVEGTTGATSSVTESETTETK
ncbi:MAG: RnfABCDGE type electron transport complex subunit G [Bacteroidales bacterium]|nr:RnfABCDGE type electron transport complex subunit G [Bacteroidales bacterium]